MRYCFNNHVLDADRHELRRGIDPVAVEPQVFDLLLHVISHRERVVTKDDLLDAVWAGRTVSELTLSSRIAAARRAIGDSGEEQGMIRTVRGSGVRFVADVREETAPPIPAAAPPSIAMSPSSDRPSLAVLPFDNLSGDPQQDYFADGIVEEITTALSRVRWFYVIARNSSFIYKGRAIDVKQVGRELGARYALQGSVRKSGDRVRIAVQLIDTTTAHYLWGDRFDATLADIFDLQDRITESVVGAIEPNVQHAEISRAMAKPTANMDAYDLYLRALPQYYAMTRTSTAAAVTLLQQAIDIDPGFALAKALLAFIHVHRNTQGWDAPGEAGAAVALACEALANDRDDPTTLSMAGHTMSHYAYDYDKARAALDRAVRLNPNGAQVLHKAGWVACHRGEPDKAIDYFSRALQLSPLDPEAGYMLTGLARACLMAGRTEEGLAIVQRAVEDMPSWAPTVPLRDSGADAARPRRRGSRRCTALFADRPWLPDLDGIRGTSQPGVCRGNERGDAARRRARLNYSLIVLRNDMQSLNHRESQQERYHR